MSKQQRVGRAGEYLAASYLARIFDEVLTTSESSRFDFFCTSDTRNIKVQVKCTDTSFDHHGSQRVRWDIKKKVSGTKQYRLYAPEEVDLFAFVCFTPITLYIVIVLKQDGNRKRFGESHLFVCLINDKVIFAANKNLGKTFQKKLDYIDTVDSMQSLELALEVLEVKTDPL